MCVLGWGVGGWSAQIILITAGVSMTPVLCLTVSFLKGQMQGGRWLQQSFLPESTPVFKQ